VSSAKKQWGPKEQKEYVGMVDALKWSRAEAKSRDKADKEEGWRSQKENQKEADDNNEDYKNEDDYEEQEQEEDERWEAGEDEWWPAATKKKRSKGRQRVRRGIERGYTKTQRHSSVPALQTAFLFLLRPSCWLLRRVSAVILSLRFRLRRRDFRLRLRDLARCSWCRRRSPTVVRSVPQCFFLSRQQRRRSTSPSTTWEARAAAVAA
jgi:hypothetical protein